MDTTLLILRISLHVISIKGDSYLLFILSPNLGSNTVYNCLAVWLGVIYDFQATVRKTRGDSHPVGAVIGSSNGAVMFHPQMIRPWLVQPVLYIPRIFDPPISFVPWGIHPMDGSSHWFFRSCAMDVMTLHGRFTPTIPERSDLLSLHFQGCIVLFFVKC